jgi:ribosomal-protein-alanine N-acetyltransferase
MQDKFETERLLLTPITIGDAPFIYELLNTPLWIKYIGERNIKTIDDAEKYIQILLTTPSLTYWVVTQKETNTPLGLITLIKRDYLEHPDIGFAFLPQYFNKGYAFEASKEILNYVINVCGISTVVAITIPENISSIHLLEKLGLHKEKPITIEKEDLLVYST